MRCLSCNAILSDFEATRKSVNTGTYLDLCNHCYYTISDDVVSLERDDLAHEDYMDSDHDSLTAMGMGLDNHDQ